jgi:hypothetical protein
MNDLFLLCSCNGDLEILLYSRHLLSFFLSFLKLKVFSLASYTCVSSLDTFMLLGWVYGVIRGHSGRWRNLTVRKHVKRRLIKYCI